ncbi:MAG: hypothetical protein HPY65_07015 [Syntrophaceae bacterium]|nr:hypothetical protein [Syntrophaceae bacterium]
MMNETGIIGMRTGGREEFNPQQNLLGRTVYRLGHHPGRPGGHPTDTGQNYLNLCCRHGKSVGLQ